MITSRGPRHRAHRGESIGGSISGRKDPRVQIVCGVGGWADRGQTSKLGGRVLLSNIGKDCHGPFAVTRSAFSQVSQLTLLQRAKAHRSFASFSRFPSILDDTYCESPDGSQRLRTPSGLQPLIEFETRPPPGSVIRHGCSQQ
jgi:hypothetical protein